MVNPELKNRVELCLKQGFSEPQVKKVLEGAGWGSEEVEAALVAVRNGEPAPDLAAIAHQPLAGDKDAEGTEA